MRPCTIRAAAAKRSQVLEPWVKWSYCICRHVSGSRAQRNALGQPLRCGVLAPLVPAQKTTIDAIPGGTYRKRLVFPFGCSFPG